jgi:hypothetical protein
MERNARLLARRLPFCAYVGDSELLPDWRDAVRAKLISMTAGLGLNENNLYHFTASSTEERTDTVVANCANQRAPRYW